MISEISVVYLIIALKPSSFFYIFHSLASQLPSLDQLDKRTGLLHVWFLLLDGLSSAVWACPKPYQPAALDTLFCLLRSTVQCPGPGFALYITNRLLLPLIQSWLRQPATTCSAGSRPETNLRQACGLATDLVVDFLQQFAASGGALCSTVRTFSL